MKNKKPLERLNKLQEEDEDEDVLEEKKSKKKVPKEN
jgi:hypothetical protein